MWVSLWMNKLRISFEGIDNPNSISPGLFKWIRHRFGAMSTQNVPVPRRLLRWYLASIFDFKDK